MTISLYSKNAFGKIQYPLSEGLGEARNKRTYINLIKSIYSKPTARVKLNGHKLDAILLKSGTRLTILSISIQYTTQSSRESNNIIKEDQGDKNLKGRSQTFVIGRSFDSIYKWPQTF